MEKYKLGKPLGQGSYANVYGCQRKSDMNIFAVKIVKQASGETDEAKTLKQLDDISHYGLPSLTEVFVENNRQHIVQELIEGPTLQQYIVNLRQQTDVVPIVPENAIKQIIRQILVTVRFCHNHGVAHQDLKTDNLIIQNNQRVVLIDFGEAYDVHLVEKESKAANHIGNLIFLPPEVIRSQNFMSQSYLDLQNLQFSAIAMEKYSNLIQTSISQRKMQLGQSSYVFQRLHHVRKREKHTEMWINALRRASEYSKIHSWRFSQSKSILEHVQESFQFEKIAMEQDNYPNAEDLQQLACSLQMEQLSAQNVHTFNSRLAADAWAIGMIGLIMLFGQRPFKDLNQFEHLPAIQILSESIRIQVEDVLQQLVGQDDDFQPYYDCQSGKISINIPEGPLPTTCPLDLFLLIGLLLHPSRKIRLSVSEALDCPFLGNDKLVDELSDVSTITRGAMYENVKQSISRFQKYKEQSEDVDSISEMFQQVREEQDEHEVLLEGDEELSDEF